ncbi:MAG: DUF721 domain-containing protein [Bacteroidetes bacterium]|nr:DUF721 domain-containing protein [Bacteroidota bacterium]MCK6611953.1 DUF721 domain-containing protein [Bacteroidia bacterium]
MRQNNEQPLKDLIQGFLKDNKLGKQLKEANLISDWEKIAGPLISRHTRKMYVNQGKLYLYMDSAPLKQELHYQRSQLLSLVNEYFGDAYVDEVIVR